MKRSIVLASITAILGVFINYVSDNIKNVIAWIILVIIVFASAVVSYYYDQKKSIKKVNGQDVSIEGDENETKQEGKDSSQSVEIKGNKNKVQQKISKN